MEYCSEPAQRPSFFCRWSAEFATAESEKNAIEDLASVLNAAICPVLAELSLCRKNVDDFQQQPQPYSQQLPYQQQQQQPQQQQQQQVQHKPPPPPPPPPSGVPSIPPPPPPPRKVDSKELGDERYRFVKKFHHEAQVHCVAVHQELQMVATADWRGAVYTQPVSALFEDGQSCNTFNGVAGFYSVCFPKHDLPGGQKFVACGCADSNVYIHDYTTGERVIEFNGHTDEVNAIDFHVSQHVMCSASDDKTVIVWDYLKGHPLRTLKQHPSSVYDATFMGNKEECQFMLATVCFDRCSRIFDMRTKSVVKELKGHNDDVIGIDFNPERMRLATGSDDGKILMYDIRTWDVLADLNTRELMPDNEVKRVRFSPCGNYLAAACTTGRAMVYGLDDLYAHPSQLQDHTDVVFDMAWAKHPRRDKYVIVTASHDETCNVFEEI